MKNENETEKTGLNTMTFIFMVAAVVALSAILSASQYFIMMHCIER